MYLSVEIPQVRWGPATAATYLSCLTPPPPPSLTSPPLKHGSQSLSWSADQCSSPRRQTPESEEFAVDASWCGGNRDAAEDTALLGWAYPRDNQLPVSCWLCTRPSCSVFVFVFVPVVVVVVVVAVVSVVVVFVIVVIIVVYIVVIIVAFVTAACRDVVAFASVVTTVVVFVVSIVVVLIANAAAVVVSVIIIVIAVDAPAIAFANAVIVFIVSYLFNTTFVLSNSSPRGFSIIDC